jgi:hypothetical protein
LMLLVPERVNDFETLAFRVYCSTTSLSASRSGLLRAPAQAGHRFLSKLDSDSCPNWTPIPAQAGHVRA